MKVEPDQFSFDVYIVDDGSPDSCGEIGDDYAKRYPNQVFCIHQENQGLGYARNTGLRACDGDYVLFTDSDDFYCRDDLLLDAYHELKANPKEDIVFIGVNYFDDQTKETTPIDPNSKPVSNPHDGVELYCKHKFELGAWCKIIRKDFLLFHDIFFPKGLCEDMDWNYRMFRLTDCFGYLEKEYYSYRKNRIGSITNHFDAKFLPLQFDILNRCFAYEKQYSPVSQSAKTMSECLLNELIYIAYRDAMILGIYDKRLKNIKKHYSIHKEYPRKDFNFMMKCLSARWTYGIMRFAYKLKHMK